MFESFTIMVVTSSAAEMMNKGQSGGVDGHFQSS